MTEKILITGALGQIGTELTVRLSEIYGKENVIASGLDKWKEGITEAGYYERLDVTNFQAVTDVIKEHNITTVYHLASLLSGTSFTIGAGYPRRPLICRLSASGTSPREVQENHRLLNTLSACCKSNPSASPP